MLDIAHLVRVSPNTLDNMMSGGVLSTDELLPRLEKWSTLGDGDFLPIGNSL